MLPKVNIDNDFGAAHDISTSIQYRTNPLWINMEDKFSRILIFQKFDKVVSRFPHLADQMFEELDYHSLTKLRNVNNSLEQFESYYLYLIKSLTYFSTKKLKKIIKEFDLDVVELASETLQDFSNYIEKTKETYFVKCVRELRDYGDTSNFDNCKRSPLHEAAENGHLLVYKLTIEKLIIYVKDISDIQFINPVGDNGETPLHIAARNGHLKICELIVKNISRFQAEIVDERQRFPLHYAAEEGHLSVCKLLLEDMKENNFADAMDDTPLHLAIRNGHESVCMLIVKNLADIDIDMLVYAQKDKLGRTALDFANEKELYFVCMMILNRIQEEFTYQRLLHEAAERGHLILCRMILINLEDKNPQDCDGSTPLHAAAKEGHLEVCKLLIKNDGNIHHRNQRGVTPLQLAIGNGQTSIVEFFKSLLSKRTRQL